MGRPTLPRATGLPHLRHRPTSGHSIPRCGASRSLAGGRGRPSHPRRPTCARRRHPERLNLLGQALRVGLKGAARNRVGVGWPGSWASCAAPPSRRRAVDSNTPTRDQQAHALQASSQPAVNNRNQSTATHPGRLGLLLRRAVQLEAAAGWVKRVWPARGSKQARRPASTHRAATTASRSGKARGERAAAGAACAGSGRQGRRRAGTRRT